MIELIYMYVEDQFLNLFSLETCLCRWDVQTGQTVVSRLSVKNGSDPETTNEAFSNG